MENKICSKCSIEKSIEDFYLRKRNNFSGGRVYRESACKVCVRAQVIKGTDREKKRTRERAYRLRKDFDMTVEEYDKLYEIQGGVCAICAQHETVSDQNGKQRYLAVDHNWNTGRIRGLLCNRCNTMLGKVKEDTELLINMIRYLKIHSEVGE